MEMGAVPPVVEESKPKPTIWGGWPTIGFSAAIFGVFFTAQNLAAVVFLVIQILRNPALCSVENLIDYLTKVQSNGLMLSTAIIFSGICGFFFIWLFVKLRRGYSFKEYLEFNQPRGRQWLTIVGAFILLLIFGVVMDRIFTDTKALEVMTEAYLSAGWIPIFWIATVIFAPIFEESFFRGFMFVGLRDSKVGPAWTVIITSVTFAVGHIQYSWQGIVSILVIGLVFGIVRLCSKSLWTTIVLHSAWNLFSMISVALYLKGLG
jgi:uncharacterized protein